MKSLYFLIVGLALLYPAAASAQLQQGGQMPRQTDPLYVAMVFYKMTGMTPDLRSWAKRSEEYQQADMFQKDAVLQEKMLALSKTFNLISPSETIILNTTAHLSHSDSKTASLVINSFGGSIKFAIQYMNEHFNIVPDKLDDMRWIRATEATAKEIMAQTENGAKARIELELTPVSAHYHDNPVERNGEIYWPPLRMKIANCRIWSADKKKMLWKNYPDDSANVLKDLFFQGER